jgi:hypothetical protein
VGWGLDAGLETVLCKKKITVVKSKEMKTGWSNLIDNYGRIFLVRLWLKKGCFAADDGDVGDDESFEYWLHYGRIILKLYKTM